MRRIPLYIYHTMALLSLLLFVMTVILWIRSYFQADFVAYTSANLWKVVSARGGMCIERTALRRRYGDLAPTAIGRVVINFTETPLHIRNWYLSKEVATPPHGPWSWTSRDAADQWLGWWIHQPLTPRSQPKWVWHMLPWGRRVDYLNGWGVSTADPGHGEEFWLAGHEVWIPYWAVALLTVPLPLDQLRRAVSRWTRRAVGTCSACGYDLRATPDRCPECGMVPKRGMTGDAVDIAIL